MRKPVATPRKPFSSSQIAKASTTCLAGRCSLLGRAVRRLIWPTAPWPSTETITTSSRPISTHCVQWDERQRPAFTRIGGFTCSNDSLELVPEDVRARIFLANLYAGRKAIEQAVRELELAVTMRPKDSNILY